MTRRPGYLPDPSLPGRLVRCPYCRAAPGRGCVTRNGHPLQIPHTARLDAQADQENAEC